MSKIGAIITFLCLGLLLILGVAAFLDTVEVSEANYSYKIGTIAEKPEVQRNEFGIIEGVRISVEGEKIPLALPGFFLKKMVKELSRLDAGDSIHYSVKKGTSLLTRLGRRRLIFSLKDSQGTLMSREQAARHYGTSRLIILVCGLFFLAGLAFFTYLWLTR